ncbi:MAG: hypothetical protein JXA71_01385 [Chitinispirillaceae bacterium]|nr:hypothetical protein [Chitinispirillaceae bacterium]
MPAFLLCMCVGFFAIQSGVYASLSKDLSYEDLTLSTEGAKVTFGNCELEREAGRPIVPMQLLTLILPPSADLARVTVSLRDARSRRLAGAFRINPGTPSVGGGTLAWPDGAVIVDGKDMTVYGSSTFYPASRCELVSTSTLGDIRLVRVKVYPVQYNPVTGALTVMDRATLVVSWQESKRTAPGSLPVDTDLFNRLKRVTDNSADFETFYGTEVTPAPGTARPGYAIITTAAIANGLSALNGFVASKEARGFTVQIVHETTWGTTCHTLRTWLKNNYRSMNIKYVLLIGNPHPTGGDVPMLMTGVTIPTDFYFAELSSNWDINNNGVYGEMTDINTTGGIDQDCEVSVGRISCYNRNYADVDRILNKIVAYENESEASARSWRLNVLFPSVLISETILGYGALEAIKNDFCTPRRWTWYRIYDRDYGVNPEQTPCSITAVGNAWKARPYGAHFWSTHGNATSASNVMNVTTAATMPSTHPSIVYQGSCLTAHPETAGNLAYTNLKNGAISTLASARISWANNDPTGRNADNEKIAYRYGKGVIGDSLACGDAVNYFRSYLTAKSTAGNWFWQNMNNFCLLGDPSVGAHTWSRNTSAQEATLQFPHAPILTRANGSVIKFHVPAVSGNGQTMVRIDLYDIHGKRVTTPVRGLLKAGFTGSVDAHRDVAAGYYVYVMRAGPHIQTVGVLHR